MQPRLLLKASRALHVALAWVGRPQPGLTRRAAANGRAPVLQVTDFDLSRQALQTEPVPYSGGAPNSPAWSAPERLKGEHYTEKADVFSFGVVLWELTCLGELLECAAPSAIGLLKLVED